MVHNRIEKTHQFRLAVLRFQHANTQMDSRRRKAGGSRQFVSFPIYEIAEFGPDRQCEQPVRSRGFSARSQRGSRIFMNGLWILALVFKDSASLVAVEGIVAELLSAFFEQPLGIFEIEVVPIDGRGLEVSAGFSGGDLGNPLPVRSRLREVFAIGIDVSDARKDLRAARICSQEV